MNLYAVAQMGEDDCIILFYVAQDKDDAKRLAFDAFPEREIVAVALVPWIVQEP